ncbi:hypothetical protein ACF06Q_08255 [Streptomyces leeuwenhoekii]|uniref:hypothetical protein n=1 Tax=Streptomyces leeuwenhoekii TaxID=1437453 RepID=UPI0036FF0EEA
MPTYEPADLDEMTLAEGINAVLADLRHHPVTALPHSVFTLMRHVDLLCHLTSRATGDAQFGHAHDHADAADRAQVEPLSRAAAHLGRATAHYTQALAPALALSKTAAPSTLQAQLDLIDARSQLTKHVHEALRALSDARTCLTGPHPSGQAVPAVPPPVPTPPSSRARH